MATLARRNLTQLVSAVSGLIDNKITANTTPSLDDVTGWLNEGAIQIFRLIPVEELRDCMISIFKYGQNVTASDFERNVLKIISVYSNGKICAKVNEEEFALIDQLRPLRYNSNQPAWAKTKRGAEVSISIYPSGSSMMTQITFLPYPFIYSSSSPTEAPDDTAVPATLEGMLIEYAAMLARIQDEEPAQYNMYMQDWRTKVQMAHGIPSESIEGV